MRIISTIHSILSIRRRGRRCERPGVELVHSTEIRPVTRIRIIRAGQMLQVFRLWGWTPHTWGGRELEGS